VGHVVVSRDIVRDAATYESLTRAGLGVSSLPEIQRSLEPGLVIFDAAPEGTELLETPAHLVLRPAIASLCQPIDRYFERLRRHIEGAASARIVSNVDSPKTAEWSSKLGADHLRVPALPDDDWLSGYSAWSAVPKSKYLMLLAERETIAVDIVRELLHGLGFEVLTVSCTRKARKPSGARQMVTAAEALNMLLGRQIEWPEVAVDLSEGDVRLQLLGEMLCRKRIPLFTMRGGVAAPATRPPQSLDFSSSFGELASALLRYRRRRSAYRDAEPADFDPDRGWAALWRATERAFQDEMGSFPE
jgi:hypothetical protein